MRFSVRVRVTGPLTAFVDGFVRRLRDQGYTDLSIRNQLHLMAHVSRWLFKGGLGLGELSPERVGQFVASRRRTHTGLVSERALRPLLKHLRQLGAIPDHVAADQPRSGLLGRYERYLLEERAVLAPRRRYCLAIAEEFLQDRLAARLTAADVTAFVQGSARRPGFSLRLSALRSLLRFLFIDGATPLNLVWVVPSTPGWRQTSLPRPLDETELQVALGTCDRRTAIGRRDYAALLLMGRLGLRAGEVAALSLDDLDWAQGAIVVHGKGGTVARLPLPADVDKAIVAHLRWRPRRHDTRAVFLRAQAPRCGVTRAAITQVARGALRAAGISSGAAHRLRHTAATQMLRHGASLSEIAQVLRHRHVDTTAIYAKVDHQRLRLLAQPWPAQHRIDAATLRSLAPPWPGGAA